MDIQGNNKKKRKLNSSTELTMQPTRVQLLTENEEKKEQRDIIDLISDEDTI
jgi:hypothetical protein